MFQSKTIGYISEIDEFLTEFNRTHTYSASQKEEVRKHQRVYRLRDDANASEANGELWEEF